MAFFESKIWPRLSQKSVQDFVLLVFPKLYSVWGVSKKPEIVCRGAQIFFGRLSRCQKRGFGKNRSAFCLSFLCWIKQKRKDEKMEKENFKSAQQIVFFGGCEEKWSFLLKWHFLEKLANTICVRKVKEERIFVATICFWKMVLFWCPYKVTKHYKNRGFSRHRGKPKMALLVAKVPFWEGASKGALLSVIPKSCALLKTLFIVFSAKHSFADMTKIYQK